MSNAAILEFTTIRMDQLAAVSGGFLDHLTDHVRRVFDTGVKGLEYGTAAAAPIAGPVAIANPTAGAVVAAVGAAAGASFGFGYGTGREYRRHQAEPHGKFVKVK